MNIIKQKITPFLWFDSEAEEAANFYVSIFDNSSVNHVSRYGDTGPGIKGSAMTVTFSLAGQQFTALNAGPRFKFTEAISFVVNCDSQDEIDNFWTKLSAGGAESQCGWLKDKYGLSWQVVPTILGELFNGKQPGNSKRAMEALLRMKKLDIAGLRNAYDGR